MPLLALAMVACMFWVALIVQGAIGAVAWFFPFGLLVLPSALGLGLTVIGVACGVLGALFFLLWTAARSRLRWLALLGLPVGLAGIELWAIARDFLAGRLGPELGADWAVLALLAQGAYGAVVLLMVGLILWPEPAPSRRGAWPGLLAVGLAWAVTFAAFSPAQDWTRSQLASRQHSLADEIPTGNRNAVVVAVCAGRLAEAAERVREAPQQLTAGDLDALESGCLNTNTSRFYGERVPVVLDAILAFEARGGPKAERGCSKRQQALLRKIYANDFPPAATRAFQDRGLPIRCDVRPDSTDLPTWWWVAHSMDRHELNLERIQRLQALGIDLREHDAQGLDFIGANPNGIVSRLDDGTLLRLTELGLQDHAGGRSPHVLVIVVMMRRWGLAASSPDSPDLARLYAKVGDPTDEQLREVMAKAPWMLRPFSDAMKERGQRLQEHLIWRLKR